MKLDCHKPGPGAAAAQKTLDDFMERAKKLLLVTALATDAAKPAALPLEATATAQKLSKFEELLEASKRED